MQSPLTSLRHLEEGYDVPGPKVVKSGVGFKIEFTCPACQTVGYANFDPLKLFEEEVIIECSNDGCPGIFWANLTIDIASSGVEIFR